MKKVLLLLAFTLLTLPVLSQEKQKQQILAEAYLLYNSEKASWNGTDIFLQKFPNKRNSMGGYFSYSEDKTHTCVFFDRAPEPKILATIKFDNSFLPETAIIDTIARSFTTKENDLYVIRKKALEVAGNDNFFKMYENTSLNMIPIIVKNEKKVYMLTGPSKSGVVIFGNDYLLEFDKKNNIKSKKALHKNIISIPYTNNPEETGAMHSHTKETGDLITATDICTLLLYAPYTQWETYYVMSDSNVSIWDCHKEILLVLTREAWEKMAGDTKKKD